MEKKILISYSIILTNDHNADLQGVYSHSLSPTQRFADYFECIDGLPISQSPLYDPTHQFKNRDPRIAYTIIDFANFTPKALITGETGESWITPISCEKAINWANDSYS